MPIALSLIRRVPWLKVWAIALWLVKAGRDRVDDNLSSAERKELRTLVAKSKGRPGNLSSRDRGRVRSIVKKAATGR